MLAQSHARKPAPPLAARGMWLRLHGGADAFGNALGDSVVGAIQRGDANKAPAEAVIDYDDADMDGEAHKDWNAFSRDTQARGGAGDAQRAASLAALKAPVAPDPYMQDAPVEFFDKDSWLCTPENSGGASVQKPDVSARRSAGRSTSAGEQKSSDWSNSLLDPTDGLRKGPTVERLNAQRSKYIDQARQVVREYDQHVNWLNASSGRVEPPPIGPDDIILGVGGVVKAGLKAGATLALRLGEADAARVAALEGSGTALARSMAKAGVNVPEGYAAHHLIPSSTVNDFKGLFSAAADHGYGINGVSNGMALPQKVADAIATGDPLHRGGHLREYFDATRAEIRSLQSAYNAGAVTAKELPQRLDEISVVMKAKLISREVFLTSKDPLYEVFRK